MLHPATDCYRGLGYHIHSEQLEVQADQTRWRCFVAERGGRAVRVCERIEDAQARLYRCIGLVLGLSGRAVQRAVASDDVATPL